MTSVNLVLSELDSAISSHSEEQKIRTVARVTDMFVNRAEAYDDEQVGVFDVVIGRLASGIGADARADLSERLADIGNAPRGVVRQLALDEILVARPVLSRSVLLTEQDLIAVASTKGRDHMLAITERPNLTEPVTDFLVVKGDRVVSHALAVNVTARFSRRGMSLLVTRSISDEALQAALGHRVDIPPELMSNLESSVRDSARRRLMSRTSSGALLVPSQPEKAPNTKARDDAAAEVTKLNAAGKLDEGALAAFASAKQVDHAVCAISVIAKISPAAAEQGIAGADRDACLVIGKAMGWSWETVLALIGLRPAGEQLPHMIDRARANYENLQLATAQRVLQFMRIKDQSAK